MKQQKIKYEDLLLSDEWEKKRAKVFKRDGYKCQQCGIGKQLNCHHTYYLSGKKPWEYPLSALLTLCKGCHTALHIKTKIKTRGIKNKQDKFIGNKTQRRLKNLYNSLSEKEKATQKRYDALRQQN